MTIVINELREIRKLLALQKEILTLEEFSTYAGISKNQAYHLTSKKKVPHFRPVGKMIYFRKEDVIEFLSQNPIHSEKTIKNKSVNI